MTRGSPAAATPVVDGESLFVYFGSFGLIRYDLDGNRGLAEIPLRSRDPLRNGHIIRLGAGLLFLNGQGEESYLLAVNPETGETAWRKPTPRSGSATRRPSSPLARMAPPRSSSLATPRSLPITPAVARRPGG